MSDHYRDVPHVAGCICKRCNPVTRRASARAGIKITRGGWANETFITYSDGDVEFSVDICETDSPKRAASKLRAFAKRISAIHGQPGPKEDAPVIDEAAFQNILGGKP